MSDGRAGRDRFAVDVERGAGQSVGVREGDLVPLARLKGHWRREMDGLHSVALGDEAELAAGGIQGQRPPARFGRGGVADLEKGRRMRWPRSAHRDRAPIGFVPETHRAAAAVHVRGRIGGIPLIVSQQAIRRTRYMFHVNTGATPTPVEIQSHLRQGGRGRSPGIWSLPIERAGAVEPPVAKPDPLDTVGIRRVGVVGQRLASIGDPVIVRVKIVWIGAKLILLRIVQSIVVGIGAGGNEQGPEVAGLPLVRQSIPVLVAAFSGERSLVDRLNL